MSKLEQYKQIVRSSSKFSTVLDTSKWFCFNYCDKNGEKVHVSMHITDSRSAINHIKHYLKLIEK